MVICDNIFHKTRRVQTKNINHTKNDTMEQETITQPAVDEHQATTNLPPSRTHSLNMYISSKTLSNSSTASSKSFCSCDSTKMQKDLLTLETDTKTALRRAWTQASLLSQEVTEKDASIDELRWKIKFCNERKMQALKYLTYLENEMNNAMVRRVVGDAQETAVTKRSSLIKSSGCAMRTLFSYANRFKSSQRNDRLYADLKLMVSSRDITIDAMEEIMKEAEVTPLNQPIHIGSVHQILSEGYYAQARVRMSSFKGVPELNLKMRLQK